MTAIDIGELRSKFSYDPQTGAVYRLQPTARLKAGTRADFVRDSGYAFVKVNEKLMRAHRVIWALVYGNWPSSDIDHANGCRSDNRLANLRLASRSENVANVRTRKLGASGYKGVVWKHKAQKWAAQIKKNGVRLHLGLFADPRDAHDAYVLASKKIYGEFSIYTQAA